MANLTGLQHLELEFVFLLQTGLSALQHLLFSLQLFFQLLQLCSFLNDPFLLFLQPTSVMQLE